MVDADDAGGGIVAGVFPLIMPNEGLAEWLEEIHGTLGTVGYFLIGFHALASLYHHYIQGDSTLLRMLPARS